MRPRRRGGGAHHTRPVRRSTRRPMTALSARETSPGALIGAGRANACLYRSATRSRNLRRPRCAHRNFGKRRLRGLLGLTDDTVETAAGYHELIERCAARALTMICANPDVVVERGHELVIAPAQSRSLWPPRAARSSMPAKALSTDLRAGAGDRAAVRGPAGRASSGGGDRGFRAHRSQGRGSLRIDCVFVTAGIHAEEPRRPRQSDTSAAFGHFSRRPDCSQTVMRRLTW